MALPGVVVKIAGEAKGAVTAIDKVGDELLKLPGQAAKAAQGVGRHAADMAGSVRKSGDSVRRTGDDLDSGIRGKAGKAFDAVGDSAIGASAQIGEAFGSGGKASTALGGMGEVVESFAGMFGPAGIIVGAIGGGALAAISGLFSKSEQKFEDLKAKSEEVFDALIAGQGRVDDAYAESAVKQFIKDNKNLVSVIRTVAGPTGLANLREALKGNTGAQGALTAALQQSRAALEAEEVALRKKAFTTGGLNDLDQKRYDIVTRQIDQIKKSETAIRKEGAAFENASDSLGLYNDTLQAGVGDVETYTDRVKKATSALNSTTSASQRARTAMDNLWKGAPAGAIAWDPIHNVWLGKGGKVLGRQAGGPVQAGQPYLVGESGPEVIVPAAAGNVIPNQQVGMGNLTVHMHLHAAVATPSVIREAAPIVTRALVDAQRRGGNRSPGSVYTSMGA